ncbi:maleylpyruvate isomerase family mycothiol-dependent enzyme [Streptomyces sp. PmtG]
MSGAPRPAPDAEPCSLLGAWLLDACSPREKAAVAAHVEHCADCSAEARDLYPAVAALAGPPRGEVPATSRTASDGVTSLAFARRPPSPRGLPLHLHPYLDQVATLDAVLRDLDDAEWHEQPVADWTVAQLVAHLAATDSLLAASLDARARGPLDLPGDTVSARTHAFTTWAAGQSPAAVHAAWRAQADLLRDVLAGPPGRGNAPRKDGGRASAERRVALPGEAPLTVADHTAGRAFETWIHTRDIALSTGRRLPPPTARSLARMSDLGVRLLPLALRARGTPLGERALSVELTGPGGGSWLLTDPGHDRPPGPPDARLVLAAVDFCLRTGDRHTPAETVARTRVTGDPALAEAALAAASAFAGP